MASAKSKVLTLVFTDLVGSTALKTDKGDETARALIGRCREAVERLSGETGGRIIDWAGDGCFQTFDTPSAAARFALKLQQVHTNEPDLPQVRTGIHMGEITEALGPGEATRVEGLAVDIAARIESLAIPGQILMSTSVFNSARQRLTGSEFESPISWRAHGAYLFKGFDDPLEVGEVGIEGVAPLTSPEASEKARRAVAPTEEDTLGWRPAAGQGIPGRSHWVLDRQLGVGGYGEVWLAENVNTRDRHVFKFCFQPDRLRGLKREVVLFRLLKESLGDRDDIARVLDWDLEKQPFFIETEYTEGGDLKIWAEEQGGIGNVPMDTRLALVIEIATALDASHSAGVLHKDIKPANILISQVAGRPKAALTDFGIGLLADPDALKAKGITATGLTKTLAAGKSSSTSGTGMYLAPELHEGKKPSEKSDIYGLGVVLYQAVIGDLNHSMAAGWERDVDDPVLREDIAACVDGDPARRLESAGELARRLKTLESRRAERDSAAAAESEGKRAVERKARGRQRLVSGLIAVAVIAVVGVLAALLMQTTSQQSDADWARQEGLPELKALVDSGEFVEAHALGRKLEAVLPGDPTLAEYISQSTNFATINTTPPGALVKYKPYERPEAEWIELGTSPINDVNLPMGHMRVSIEKEGHAAREPVLTVPDREFLSRQDPSNPEGRVLAQIALVENSQVPEGTLVVDAGVFIPGLTGITPTATLFPSFFVDRTEVTNKAYKEFVDVGGYTDPKYWKQPFVNDGAEIFFDEAAARFVDATGRAAPATWIQGDYPDGEDDYPVRGVSWYEAAAYAEFRGKALPTIYHWSRMAHPTFEILYPLSPLIEKQSQWGGDGPAAVASNSGIGGSGAYDVAGNVREWCWNDNGSGRYYALGGAWSDPPYMYTLPQAQSPWDRFDTNGFRCVAFQNGVRGPQIFYDSVEDLATYPFETEPLSEEIYEIYKQRFSYVDTPLRPTVESEPHRDGDSMVETVSIAAAYGDERFEIHLLLPAEGNPPYKASVFVPGINAMSQPAFAPMPWEEYAFVPKSGRAVIKPVLAGMYERSKGTGLVRYTDPSRSPELLTRWVKDMARTIDYLETRDDIDTGDLGYIGFSMGAMSAPLFLGTDDRIKFGILASGGLPFSDNIFSRELSPTVYIPGINIPVLMMNGRHDYVFPVDAAQKNMIDNFGTPPEHKKHIIYEAGHAPLPPVQVIKDTLDWLDRYQPIASGN